MFKHILVPLDGSRMAEVAIPAAIFFGEKLNAKITLVHLVEKNAPVEIHGEPHLKNVKEAEDYFIGLVEKIFPKHLEVDFHVHSTDVEDVTEGIVNHSSEFDHDLILMASHGRGKTLRLFFGSIPQKVISQGSIPVLIIPTTEKEWYSNFSCENILLPLDGKPDHDKSLVIAEGLAKAFSANIHLELVIPDFGSLSGQLAVTSRFLPGATSRMLEMSVQNGEDYLNSLLENLRKKDFSVSAEINRGDPAKIIISTAKIMAIDLIILATHGKTGMKAFWNGSLTNKICSDCKFPLLLIPVKNPENSD
ncbi:MAG: universal stress protein [Candidatus Riflebacteria bacterium]|nr:universal stress protein [Candidatus Riflebacteria bacterium]